MSDLRDRTARAYKMCLKVAAKNEIVDESTRECEAWLVRNRRAEYVTTERPLRDLFVRHDGRGEPLPLPDVLR
jgi:hypothetical protein